MPRLIAFLAALLCVAAAWADGFQVQPVQLALRAGQASTLLTVSNPTATPVLIHAEAFAWRQERGEDVLEPAPQLLLNPPIFELAPGARQLLRAGFKPGAALPSQGEASYRIWLSQVPTETADATQGVRLLFRLSLPLFVAGRNTGAAQPDWQIDGAELTLANHGQRHLQLYGLSLRNDAGERLELPMRYVLAGARGRWPLPPAWRGRALQVEANSNVGPVAVHLAPAP